jgi:aspartyl-tRNA(Asn)/glutamyl-tRNA(Gln) amidotransferase subunit C
MISREEVLHIAKLAKLKLTDDEVVAFQKQLSEILEYFKKLEKIDTTTLSPMKHVLDVHSVLRPDEPIDSLPIEDVLKNAPQRRDRFFQVPKVVDKD